MGKLDPAPEEEMKSDSAFRQKKNHIRFKTWTRDTNILKTKKKLCNNSRGNGFTDVTQRTELQSQQCCREKVAGRNGFCTTDEIMNCTAKPRKDKDFSDKELIYKMCKGPVQFSSLKKMIAKWDNDSKGQFSRNETLTANKYLRSNTENIEELQIKIKHLSNNLLYPSLLT